MLNGLTKTAILACCFSLISIPASAQEVVHALTGTVNHIDPAAKIITVITDDGSEGTFKEMESARKPLEFDKNIRSEATAAGDFKDQGARVIVYYYGLGEGQTAVALHSLGAGPFTTSTGTVVKCDKGEHSISIKIPSGVVESIKITKDTVADTDNGAAEGLKFNPQKGDRVDFIAVQGNGSLQALFIKGA